MRGPERPKAGSSKPQGVPDTQLGLGLPGLKPPVPADGTSVISKPEDQKVGGDTRTPVISTEDGGDSLGDQYRAIEAYKRKRGSV